MRIAVARAVIDQAEAALRELLTCVELSDGDRVGEPTAGATVVRWLAGCPEDRHQAAKAKARQALDDIKTLRGE